MADNGNEDQKSRVEQQREDNVKLDYYDEVEEGAHARSAENVSVPDARTRDGWQSTTIGTDGNGPNVEDVVPAFAQFRADALANPTFTKDESEVSDEERADTADAAEEAQAEADKVREAGGYAADTGADAGQYDDPKLEEQVPGENFAPEPDDVRENRERAEKERADLASTQNAHTDEVDQTAPQSASEGDKAKAEDTQESDKTHADLTSDTAGEQGGLDSTSHPDAKPKTSRAKSKAAKVEDDSK